MTVADADPDFDTLAVARDLEASGVGKEPAEAVARAIRQGRAGLATKADLDNLESRMQATLHRALWMQTGAIVGTIVATAGVVVAAVALL